MKTFIFSFITSIFLFFFGCHQSQKNHSKLSSWMENNGKIKVLSTTAMIDDLVGEIGKERIDHLPLIVGEMDPHSYELVKGDDEKLSFANLLFYNGLGLEHGASLRYRLQAHPHAIGIGNEVRKKHPECILIINDQIDPHIWMDISLWVLTIDSITEALIRQDPEMEAFYEKNAEELKSKMLVTHEKIKKEMQTIPLEKRYLVTSHDAFNYFTHAYLGEEEIHWKNHCAAPEGLAPDGQLSVADIQRMIQHICTYRIPVLFPESNISRDALKKIISACCQKGVEVRISDEPLYGDTIGLPGSDADSYLKMIEHNASVLLKNWKQQ